MKKALHKSDLLGRRQGSTLVIVIAMLGLLAFLGTVFYVFSVQEQRAAEHFNAAAKTATFETDDPFPFALRQLIVGPTSFEKFSILGDVANSQRHSMVRNLTGVDIAPHTGLGVRAIYHPVSRLPLVDKDYDNVAEGVGVEDHLNFVDSYAAWADSTEEAVLAAARDYQGPNALPLPDVDYTYPDINTLFLGMIGSGIRDNGTGTSPRYERVRTIIPSFFRPQYLKSAQFNDITGTQDVPTDADWFDATAHPEYQARSFRPHPNHVGAVDDTGNIVYRFLEATRDSAILPASGAFPFGPNEGDNSAAFGHLGPWTGHAPDDFELDSDNDRDGIKEGIWLDLQAPVQETPDGRFYVTMYSMTVLDLDGLLDLNVVGNLAQLPRNGAIDGTVLGSGNLFATTRLSDSNLGLGPNEISALYAMVPDTVEASATSDYVRWYGANPFNALEQSNMEWTWLLTGRMESNGTDWTDVFSGRWGDTNATIHHKINAASSIVSLPRPGVATGMLNGGASPPSFGGNSGTDDNQDSLEGIASTQTGVLQGYIHPLDFSGAGGNRAGADVRFPNLVQDNTSRPEAWLQYNGYSLVGDTSSLLTDSPYIAGRDGVFGSADDLITVPVYNPLFEDPLEVLVDLDRALRPHDQLFSAEELVVGHLVDADVTPELSTRLRDLLPSTFVADADLPPGEDDRSDRFTTLSNSFRSVPLVDQAGDGPRSWEWNADSDGDQLPEFPPEFVGAPAYSAQDPFRPEVRRLLTIESGEQFVATPQLLLSINHLLDISRTTNAPEVGTPAYLTHMEQFGLQFRALTEHANATDPLTTLPAALPQYPPQSVGDREFWARRDRQKMARDIYVLLYTLGGAELSGANVLDYTMSNQDRSRYSEERLRQMAQFAVNLVDAMDTDNVITRFEYDKNLGNGWGLDDDPWTSNDTAATVDTTTEPNVTADGMYPEDVSDRGVVYGVESQQLAFSEALGVYSEDFPNGTSNSPATVYDDVSGLSAGMENRHRYFLHLELQNMLPMAIELASSVTPAAPAGQPTTPAEREVKDRGIWRIKRFDRITSATAAQNDEPARHRTLTLMDGNAPLGAGERFTIAMAAQLDETSFEALTGNDPNGFGTADVYLDITPQDGTYELISPDVASTGVISGATPAPMCDLDLIHSNHDSRWVLSDGESDYALATDHVAASRRGFFLEQLNDSTHQYEGNAPFGNESTDSVRGFEVVLQRRMNPNLPLLPINQNPWVDVDRTVVDFEQLFTFTGSTATEHPEALTSYEREEPLNATEPRASVILGKETPPADARYNSVGNVNDRNRNIGAGTVEAWTLWQAHFDRDYASPGELLNLPIVGPQLLTRAVNMMRQPGYQQLQNGIDTTSTAGDPANVVGAAGMFLYSNVEAGNSVNTNAWYRLLQFLEVPSRVNRVLGNYINLQRLPGKVNWNTIRHREVYAGVVDEPAVADLTATRDSTPFLVSSAADGDDGTPGFGSAIRDRWVEFINERDGYVNGFDPDAATTVGFWLPGTPNSRPFRSLGFTARHAGSGVDVRADETILRRLAVDLTPSDRFNITGEGTAFDPGTGSGSSESNRHWLEPGSRGFHETSGGTANMVHRHQLLSKVMSNTTTVSNCFLVYATAAYFEAVIDPSGAVRVGGRMGLDLDNDSNERNDAGWEKRAVFVIDRSELYNAYDSNSGSIEWERLVRFRYDLDSDGQ